jgi:hypothetical protein
MGVGWVRIRSSGAGVIGKHTDRDVAHAVKEGADGHENLSFLLKPDESILIKTIYFYNLIEFIYSIGTFASANENAALSRESAAFFVDANRC